MPRREAADRVGATTRLAETTTERDRLRPGARRGVSASTNGTSPIADPDGWRPPHRVLYLVSHPIPYQEPLLRHLARSPRVDLTVRFLSDFSLRDHEDPGFGGEIGWDTPLARGYRRSFLSRGSRPPGRTTGLLGRWADDIDRDGFDAVWLHGYYHLAHWRAALTAKRRGLPVLLRGETPAIEGLPERAAWRTRLLQRVVKTADAYLAIGSANARFWVSHGADPERVFFMPYAVDNAWFAARARIARPRRAATRAELGLAPDRPVLLFVGKLVARKRVTDLLEAAARAARRLPAARRPYVLVAGDGPDREDLERRARTLPDRDAVRFVGFQTPARLPRLLDLADALVLPSDDEPWGLVVNEAMACGTPAVVSDLVGCGPDLVDHGRTGLVTRCGDVAALADALVTLCDDPALPARLGRAARHRVDAFSIEADAQGLTRALAAVAR